MKIVEINSVGYGSTGNIAVNIIKTAEKFGHVGYLVVPKGRHNKVKPVTNTVWVGNRLSEDFHILLRRITGYNGVFSYFATKKLIGKLRAIKPEIVHLHNLHSSFINLPVLIKHLNEENIKVVWTLHDCWAFTGHCPHFIFAKCDKWKTGCSHCVQYRRYPQSLFDNSAKMYRLKKKWFTSFLNLNIVTPSKWLKGLVEQSFLKDYPVKVINNGIDLSVFKPTESDFKKRYGISENHFIVLGVAFGWGVRKGLDAFIELSKRLPDNYRIVLVGTNDKIDKLLPENIISIHRTQNQTELAEIYTAADVFVNPTREEVLGLVNIEALACGTPVLTFASGGSPECVDDTCGSVVPSGDVNAMQAEILRICNDKPFLTEKCVNRAQTFDKNKKFKEYVSLYESLIK